MRVIGLGTCVPAGRISQAQAAQESLALAGADARQQRMLRALYLRSGVRTRHSVIVEGGAPEQARQRFFRAPEAATDRGPTTAERMREYEAAAEGLAVRAAGEALEGWDRDIVTHVVTVSCTGFFAPGIDVGLVRELGLRPSVERTQVGFMGCHGLFNGLAVARALVRADPGSSVLVCATELCSIHYQYGWDSERLVANALFADGAAALLCTGGDGPGLLRIDATGSQLVPGSEAAMTWRVRDHGFEMTLSPEVPQLIRDHLPAGLAGWLDNIGTALADVRTWAVHPGGPRILSAVEQALALDASALAASRDVLARYGNMSSATIAFILRDLAQAGAPGPAVAIGFGPGMIVEMFRFSPINP